MNLIYRLFPFLFCGAVCYSSVVFASLSGKEIYETHCHVCHASGLAGAPKFQEHDDWSTRCKQKHLSDLVKSAMQGLNAMPAKGTCEACRAEDIKHAIEYMVPKDDKKCH